MSKKIEVTITREEVELRWIAMNRGIAAIHIAMRNSALGAVFGNQQARDQFIALRERAETQERELSMLGWALGEFDQIEAQERSMHEKELPDDGDTTE